MLTREEAKAMPRVSSHFDEIDANHDGQVSMDEIRAYAMAARQSRGS
jgi:Ca2+-binding EF-hand superfamily protein